MNFVRNLFSSLPKLPGLVRKAAAYAWKKLVESLGRWWNMKTAKNKPDEKDEPFHEVLLAELEEIENSRALRQPGRGYQGDAAKLRESDAYRASDDDKKRRKVRRKANRFNLLGLAFSGGGVRSATFNLGVLQALARYDLLPRIDYLSTVSGGGYIGAWLTTWIKRDRIDTVAKKLAGESPQVTYLRSFSSYLTPKSGLFSLDTWTLPATYLRNVVLNLTILILALAAVMIVPRMIWTFLEGICAVGKLPDSGELDGNWLLAFGAVVIAGAACAFLVVLSIVENFVEASRNVSANPQAAAYRELSDVQWQTVPPLFGAAFFLVMGIRLAPDTETWRLGGAIVLPLVIGVMATVAALLHIGDAPANLAPKAAAEVQKKRKQVATKRAALATLAGLVGGAVLYFAVPDIREGFPSSEPALRWMSSSQAAIVWGIPLANFIFSIAATFYIGFMRNQMDTFQREWWARLGALVLMYSLAWAGLFLIALGSGGFLAQVREYPWLKELLASGWVGSTISGIVLGRSSQTGGESSGPMREAVLKVAPYVFVLGLLVFVSQLSQDIVCVVGVEKSGWLMALMLMAGVVAVLSICAGVLSWRVEINHFSMHNFYRNRLVRAYVGASKAKRNFHPFTGFDPDEDYVRIADMVLDPPLDPQPGEADPKEQRRPGFHYVYPPPAPSTAQPAPAGPAPGAAPAAAGAVAPGPAAPAPVAPAPVAALAAPGAKSAAWNVGVNPPYVGPYPIMNAALNLVSGKNLAWQKRKARSFVFTPLYSGYDVKVGSESLTEQTGTTAELAANAYRPTKGFLGGFTLGTAMAISGAAASPNMGYHSTPAIGFLMTVFNVRLGWWLGNPRSEHTWDQPGPRLGLLYLFVELFGLTNEERGYVYLSDGGHFDNLGIYELVQRGCRFIIACDAEEDPGLQFDALGNAIEKCRTDFSVEIDIDVDPIRLTRTEPAKGRHCAVGTIDYGPKLEKGTLLYIKATLTGDEPADVIRYKNQNPAFPHQSTADQWFDETQFESYRVLGRHILEAVLDTVAERDEIKAMPIEELFVKLRRLWYPPSQAVEQSFTRHAEEFQTIMDEMRNSNELRFLDRQISPGFGKAVQSAGVRPVPDDFSNWVPTEYSKLRAGYYMCSRMIQLMENVFLDLNLSLEYDHPDNQGWMNLFQRWSGSGMLQVTWAISAPIYGARFREFCHRRLGMERGAVGSDQALKVNHDAETGPVGAQLERQGCAGALSASDCLVIDALLSQPELRGRPMLVYPLKVTVKRPDRTGEVSGDIGFALVSGGSEKPPSQFRPKGLACLWIQEHLRSTNLGRQALACLMKERKVDRALRWMTDEEPRDIKVGNKDDERVLIRIDYWRFRALYRSVENELS